MLFVWEGHFGIILKKGRGLCPQSPPPPPPARAWASGLGGDSGHMDLDSSQHFQLHKAKF